MNKDKNKLLDRNPLDVPQIHDFINKGNKNNEKHSQEKKNVKNNDDNSLLRRSYFVTQKLNREIKIRAALDGVNDCEIVQSALNQYLGFAN